jgi:hypothetical protein
MPPEPSTTEPQRRSPAGTAVRWLGLVAAAAFMGLLVYRATPAVLQSVLRWPRERCDRHGFEPFGHVVDDVEP